MCQPDMPAWKFNLFWTEATVDPYLDDVSATSLQDAGGQEHVDAQSPLLAWKLSFATSNAKPSPDQGETSMFTSVVAGLSHANARKRVSRLMQRKADGSFKVPEDLVKAWKDGDQDRMVEEFLNAGMDKDSVVEIPTLKIAQQKMKNLIKGYGLSCFPVRVVLDAILFWRVPLSNILLSGLVSHTLFRSKIKAPRRGTQPKIVFNPWKVRFYQWVGCDLFLVRGFHHLLFVAPS